MAVDFDEGQKLLDGDKLFEDYQDFFGDILEIGRRYKIMNPEKMRTEYGKLVYLLQDMVNPAIEENLEFSCMQKVKTVWDFLEERDALEVLDDELVAPATMEIIDDGTMSRNKIQEKIKIKEKSVEVLAEKVLLLKKNNLSMKAGKFQMKK